MKFAVVTTFSPKGYEVYGRRMLETFEQYWPQDVDLYVFHEGERPADGTDRAIWIDLDRDLDRKAFLERNQDPPEDKEWDYRFRVATYSHKVFAQTAAPRTADRLIWLDSDIETINSVTHGILEKVVPRDGKIASYLGRAWYRHSETGFLGYALDDEGRRFLDDLRAIYVRDAVLQLPERHDAFVFDHLRRKYERQGYRFLNLSADCMGLDVFEQTPLGRVMRHNKGPKRKLKVYGDRMDNYTGAA